MADGGSGQEEHCTPSCESNDDASDGTTPLHWACIDGDLNTVQYLIREEHCNPSCDMMAIHHFTLLRRYGHLNIAQSLAHQRETL